MAESNTCDASIKLEPSDLELEAFQFCVKTERSDIACDPLTAPEASVQSVIFLGDEISTIIDSARSIPVKTEITIDIEREGSTSDDSTRLKIESETDTVPFNNDIQLSEDAATIITYDAGSRVKTESIQFDHNTWAQRLKSQSSQSNESTSVEFCLPRLNKKKEGKKLAKNKKRASRKKSNPASKKNIMSHSLLRAHLEDRCNGEFSENIDIPEALLSVHVEIDELKNDYVSFDSAFGSRNDTRQVTYQCDLCIRSFNYKSSFLTHQLTHSRRNERLEDKTVIEDTLKKKSEKTFECKYCNKKFAQSNDLTRHVRTHTGEKLFSCNVCYKKFAQRSDLTRHTRTHTGEKPFKCPVCGKEFGITSNLSQHMRIHTGEKPHDCTICNKKFTHRSDLSKHMSSHTGIKPFECPVCDRKFIQRSDLTKHMNIHTGERPYECKICSKRFIRSTHLSKHMRTHNKNGELDLKAAPTIAALPVGINSSDASTFMSAAIEAARMFAANPLGVPTTADSNTNN